MGVMSFWMLEGQHLVHGVLEGKGEGGGRKSTCTICYLINHYYQLILLLPAAL